MGRREFLGVLAVATAAGWSSASQCQSGTRPRIGVLMGFPENDARGQAYVLAMRKKLEGLGWIDSRNIRIHYRWAGGDQEKARIFAKELIGMTPAVIVTSTNQVTETVRQETQTIPIVFASLGDPVWQRPGCEPGPALAETLPGFLFSWTPWEANGLSSSDRSRLAWNASVSCFIPTRSQMSGCIALLNLPRHHST